MAHLLEIKDMTKTYKNGRGVRNIDLTLEEKQVLALLGPNGAGKTTILKSITGLLKKDNGQVLIGEVDLEKNYEIFIGQIGCMIGTTSHQEYLTGLEQLKLKGNYFNVTTESLENLLQEVGLYEYKDELIKNYSTGMKQRLAIAFALVGEPKLLLLDEPFSGMDVDGKRQMRLMLQKLIEQRHLSIIISSHTVGEIEPLYTKMAVLQEGALIKLVDASVIQASEMNLEDYYVSVVDEYKANKVIQPIIKSGERRKAV